MSNTPLSSHAHFSAICDFCNLMTWFDKTSLYVRLNHSYRKISNKPFIWELGWPCVSFHKGPRSISKAVRKHALIWLHPLFKGLKYITKRGVTVFSMMSRYIPFLFYLIHWIFTFWSRYIRISTCNFHAVLYPVSVTHSPPFGIIQMRANAHPKIGQKSIDLENPHIIQK